MHKESSNDGMPTDVLLQRGRLLNGTVLQEKMHSENETDDVNEVTERLYGEV